MKFPLCRYHDGIHRLPQRIGIHDPAMAPVRSRILFPRVFSGILLAICWPDSPLKGKKKKIIKEI
jgi:hypothetical protein